MKASSKESIERLTKLLLGIIILSCNFASYAQEASDTAIVKITPPETKSEKYLSAYKQHTVALKTNVLFDAVLMPNVGIELPVAQKWSIALDWTYGWWRLCTDNYWRMYGGDIEGRYWLSPQAHHTYSGHHIGAYAQMLTYDFEFGGKGYMGGKPHGSIWDKASYGAGISYGYALRVAQHLSIDFTIGLGYLGGDYQEYHPDNGCYVYDRTRRLNYFGVTRAEIQLVWLIGASAKKGGLR